MANISPEIFKAYDIRGIVGETLTDEAAMLIGKAIASEAVAIGVKEIAVARDGRLSGSHIAELLMQSLTDAGLDVLYLGATTTPMLYFAAHTRTNGTGVMITGSHNPPDYNGFKMMIAGETYSGNKIQNLLHRIQNDDFLNYPNCSGSLNEINIADEYIEYIAKTVQVKRPIKAAIDAGNGIAGAFAKKLFEKIGVNVLELFCEVDGNFPNHHPDPAKPENLKDLQNTLKTTDCEIGLAFDGDGDRLGVVTKDGNIIYPDRQLMLFAQDILTRQKNAKIIFDVKCSRLLKKVILQNGGEPILCKTGHSFIKAAIKEHNAQLAGEMSGHLFFKENWFGFDDGLYAGCRLLQILSQYDNPSEILNNLPNAFCTPEINIQMAKEGDNHALIKELQATAQFKNAEEIITIDGLRVEYKNGFGLIRASNTTPVLVLRFEADNEESLQHIQKEFAVILKQYGIEFNFVETSV